MGLSQSALARRMGSSQQAVARLESRHYEGFTWKTLEKLAVALGATLVINLRKVGA
jgi:transcriptional regulator with XRE-family HTH domain